MCNVQTADEEKGLREERVSSTPHPAPWPPEQRCHRVCACPTGGGHSSHTGTALTTLTGQNATSLFFRSAFPNFQLLDLSTFIGLFTNKGQFRVLVPISTGVRGSLTC